MTAAVISTAWTTADTGTLAVAGLFLVAFAVAYVLDARREARPVRRAGRPLAVGRLVQIDAGDHAGLCGWVRAIRLDPAGRASVLVELQAGRLVHVDRRDVSPLFG